jgi:hypothetical protein
VRVPNKLNRGETPRIVRWLIALLALSCLAASGSANAQRLSIHVYKYSVPPADSDATEYRDQFASIIKNKVVLLGAELGNDMEKYKSLSFIRVEKNGEWQESSDNAQQLDDRWNQANALQLFLGRVLKVNDAYVVRTRVFFGQLPADVGGPFLNIDMLISGDEFDSTRDSHSGVILYALALDACQRSRPTNEVITLLSKAKESLTDLSDDLKGIPALKIAIDAALANSGSCGGDSA